MQISKNFLKISLLTATLIAIIFIFFHFNQQLSFPDANWSFENKSRFDLPTNATLFQKFTANRNGLSKIGIYLADSNSKSSGKLQVKILDENCLTAIREKDLDISSFDSSKLYTVPFPPITNSINKNFCLSLQVFSETRKTLKIYMINNSNFGSAFFSDSNQDEIKNRSLAMRPVYVNDHWWQNIQELNQRISQYKPWFLKHYFLYFFAFGFITLSFLFLILILV